MPSYKDFEKVADILEEYSRTLPRNQKEVALRRAISTIYYGVFWELRERMKKRGYKIRDRQPHSILLGLLRELNFITYQRLERLKKFRELADYQTDWIPNRKTYLFAKSLANLILEEV